MHSPLFLIGTQRSGTTLLCRMLSAHKDIYIKNEVHMRTVFAAGASRFDIEKSISDSIKLQYGKSTKDL